MTRAATEGFWVRVPASTSNLGPGFDCLGMAVDRFLTLEYTPDGVSGDPGGEGERAARSEAEGAARGGTPVVRGGTLAALGASGGWDAQGDLVLEHMLEVKGDKRLEKSKMGPWTEGRLSMHSEIPLGRGLGSSAAARVAGHVARLLLEDQKPNISSIVSRVAEAEGHPDNAAPAVLGGLVAARMGSPPVPLPVSSGLGWAFAAPGTPLSTQDARRVLPDLVPHRVAVRNAARLALLIPALAAGDGPLLARAMEDELHVPFRLPLIPGGREAIRAAMEAGAWAVTLSGAGSGLLAVTPRDSDRAVAQAMGEAFRASGAGGEGVAWPVRPCLEGAAWGLGPLPAVRGGRPGGSAPARG